jgi:AcrR family transcriptional regulator
MARTPSITDEEILQAARDAFFESGLSATTAEIARRAGISEGTIFRRFPTKHELFMAAMGISPRPTWIALTEEFQESGGDDVRTNLTRLAHEMIAFFEELIPKMSMVMADGSARAEMFERMAEPPPVRGLKALATYLQSEQRRGRVRRCDTEIAARMFLGSIQNYAFFEFCGFNDFLPMPQQTFVRGVVDNLLRGIEQAPPSKQHED